MVSHRKLRKVFLCGVGVIVVAWIALPGAYLCQDWLIYPPVIPFVTKSYSITPDRHGLIYEDEWLRSSDGVRLHAWFIKLYPNYTGPTILFFQGNAGSLMGLIPFGGLYLFPAAIADRLYDISTMMMPRLQCNVFMLSYRGYGASDGYPSQYGITLDAQAALDHLVQRTDIDTSRIVAFGRSLGGAVGAALTKNNPDKVAALILENTFTSILDMPGAFVPFLKCFFGGSGFKSLKVLNFIITSPWSTIDIIGQIKQPILFLSGLEDDVVPPVQMQMLYAAAHNQQCTFVTFPTGTHMDTPEAGGDHYWRMLQQFLQQNVPRRRDSISSNKGEGFVARPSAPVISLNKWKHYSRKQMKRQQS